MQSIIAYQNQAFYIHLDQVTHQIHVHIYKDQILEKNVQVDRSNFIKVDFPEAKGKYLIKISTPKEEFNKTIII
jgi:uncharacterized protein YfaS (alpha-2-macroglobulin family)